MKQKWEVIHWPNGGRMELCETKELADRLAMIHGKNHIVREVWFLDDGTLYGKPHKLKK